MSGKVFTEGFSALSPLGFTPEENYRAVLESRSALRLHEGEFGVREPFVASLFDRVAVREEAHREGVSGYGFFDTLAILAAAKAVRDAGIDPASDRVLFVLSTIKGIAWAAEEDITTACFHNCRPTDWLSASPVR